MSYLGFFYNIHMPRSWPFAKNDWRSHNFCSVHSILKCYWTVFDLLSVHNQYLKCAADPTLHNLHQMGITTYIAKILKFCYEREHHLNRILVQKSLCIYEFAWWASNNEWYTQLDFLIRCSEWKYSKYADADDEGIISFVNNWSDGSETDQPSFYQADLKHLMASKQSHRYGSYVLKKKTKIVLKVFICKKKK